MNADQLRAAVIEAHRAGNLALLSQLQARVRALPVHERNAITGPLVQVERVVRTAVAVDGDLELAPATTPVPQRVDHDDDETAVDLLGPIPPIVPGGENPFRISFGPTAREAMLRGIATAADGLEWGGYLYATDVRSWNKRISIIFARGAGPKAKRAAGSLRFDDDPSWVVRGEVKMASGNDISLLGDWHTHSNDLGPSDNDLACWRRGLEALEASGRSHYIGLIATPGGVGPRGGGNWSRPELEAFVVHRDRRGVVVCERAEATLSADLNSARRD